MLRPIIFELVPHIWYRTCLRPLQLSGPATLPRAIQPNTHGPGCQLSGSFRSEWKYVPRRGQSRMFLRLRRKRFLLARQAYFDGVSRLRFIFGETGRRTMLIRVLLGAAHTPRREYPAALRKETTPVACNRATLRQNSLSTEQASGPVRLSTASMAWKIVDIHDKARQMSLKGR